MGVRIGSLACGGAVAGSLVFLSSPTRASGGFFKHSFCRQSVRGPSGRYLKGGA